MTQRQLPIPSVFATLIEVRTCLCITDSVRQDLLSSLGPCIEDLTQLPDIVYPQIGTVHNAPLIAAAAAPAVAAAAAQNPKGLAVSAKHRL